MENRWKLNRRWLRLAPLLIGAALAVALYGQRLASALSAIGSALVMAFLLDPLAQLIKRRTAIAWSACVALALVGVVMLVGCIVLVAVPPLIGQVRELSRMMSGSVARIKAMLRALNTFLAARGLPQIDASQLNLGAVTGIIPDMLSGTTAIAGGMIGRISEFAFSLVLAFYLLLYKSSLMLSFELSVPMAWRMTVMKMAGRAANELRQYLRSQLTVAVIVGALSALGLMLIRAPSAVLMGLLMGLFNMIPYFGSLIGSVIAVLMSLSGGLGMAIGTAAVAFVVQQLDSFLISPRVMGAMTGLSPPLVLMAIMVGNSLFGIGGMFFAIPVLLIARICVRVWTIRDESVEKWPKM